MQLLLVSLIQYCLCWVQLVAGSVVMAFEEVCPERIDLIHKNYRKLCNLLIDVEEWGQVVIINMLTRYARTQFLNPNINVRTTILYQYTIRMCMACTRTLNILYVVYICRSLCWRRVERRLFTGLMMMMRMMMRREPRQPLLPKESLMLWILTIDCCSETPNLCYRVATPLLVQSFTQAHLHTFVETLFFVLWSPNLPLNFWFYSGIVA